MAFLLDTHAFLWFVSGDKRLPQIIDAKQMVAVNKINLRKIYVKIIH